MSSKAYNRLNINESIENNENENENEIYRENEDLNNNNNNNDENKNESDNDNDNDNNNDNNDDDDNNNINNGIINNNNKNNNNNENNNENNEIERSQIILQPIIRKPKIEKKQSFLSKYLKSIIYGGMDGLVSIFVSIAVSFSSSDAKISVLLIIVLSKLVAGAISMGMGDYLGTQADIDFARGERKREAWEVEYYLEGEKSEMVEIYTKKGIPEEVAREVVDILSLNPKGFVDVMMVEELGIMPDVESQTPWKNGLVNFTSFVFFGILPLLPYLAFLAIATVAKIPSDQHLYLFLIVIGITALTLFLIGIFKAKSTDTKWYKSGATTVIFGVIGAAAGLGTVELIKVIFPNVDISQ
ncbi:transmembrane protein [Dictyostelium discoideum AX4]|uniref:Transmembrane protein n=1 Tax=Dictyostelium discoideum TaxID=44689 RepID=Q54H47_DICDI|nr:transmembrane protein [Dictyostelium discoideum AX4]EAL62565.1 transmembrane protein [Dictyostelium discoideum AX4]|eukprot:XP_636071.1 transmembrane protein [Dictyostelium discoideum AX4]